MNAMWSGYIDTPLPNDLFSDSDAKTRWEVIRDIHPTQTWNIPDDMTNLVTWLAPDKTRCASAQLWILGGGPNDQIQEIKDHEKPK